MRYITKKDLVSLKRKKDSHKGDNGNVLVIGGSEKLVGAVALAGIAALRSGVDWVTVAAPKKVGWAVSCISADLVVSKYRGRYFKAKHAKKIIRKDEPRHDIVLLGNGLGNKSERFVLEYVRESQKKLVIDADAVKAVSIDMLDNAILTPHKREFEKLLKNSKLKDKKQLQKKLRSNVVILKGRIDEIITKDDIFYNKTGNEGMTKAGTGDVLAGLAAGFYAQVGDNTEAGKLAAYYNGLIGDVLLKKKKGYYYLASDMVEEIKRVS